MERERVAGRDGDDCAFGDFHEGVSGGGGGFGIGGLACLLV